MKTASIVLDVDAELAEAYKKASSDDKRKAKVWFELWLRQISSSEDESLNEIMDRISDKAQAQGLTEEILEELLKDE